MTNAINVIPNNVSSADSNPCLGGSGFLKLDMSQLDAAAKNIDDWEERFGVDLQVNLSPIHKSDEAKILQYCQDTQESFNDGSPELSDIGARSKSGVVRFDSDAIKNGRIIRNGNTGIINVDNQEPLVNTATSLDSRTVVIPVSGAVLNSTDRTQEEIQLAEKALEAVEKSKQMPKPKSILKPSKYGNGVDEFTQTVDPQTNGSSFFCLCQKRK